MHKRPRQRRGIRVVSRAVRKEFKAFFKQFKALIMLHMKCRRSPSRAFRHHESMLDPTVQARQWLSKLQSVDASPTSDSSNMTVLLDHEPSKCTDLLCLSCTAPKQTMRQHQPSIYTTEQAAAAKTFLELHYRNLESAFANPNVDPLHLRQLRALKTKISSEPVTSDPYKRTNLELQRPLGKGSFGLVQLVKEKHTNRVYAMKIMRKNAMLTIGQEAHLKCERDLLAEFATRGSKWTVPLVQAFQDHENLYLVMEFMEGGDFLALLLREDVLTEPQTRFYVGEMICAVEEVHKKGWIHRDLKPDNFLVAADGHLKLTDFGLAFSDHWSHQGLYYSNSRLKLCEKLGIRIRGDSSDTRGGDAESTPQIMLAPEDQAIRPDKTISQVIEKLDRASWRRQFARSVVGTSQYMAPEVIEGRDYDGGCDWWSIGIIFYECLYGMTPFYDSSRERIKAKAVAWPRYLHFPNRPRLQRPHTVNPISLPLVEQEAVNFMSQVICNAEARLTLEQIKAHEFFRGVRGFNWDELIRTRPPWVPALQRRNNDLAQWFEPASKIGPMEEMHKRPRDKILRDPACGPIALEIRKQKAFLGYTFKRSEAVCWLNEVESVVDTAAQTSTWVDEVSNGLVAHERPQNLVTIETCTRSMQAA